MASLSTQNGKADLSLTMKIGFLSLYTLRSWKNNTHHIVAFQHLDGRNFISSDLLPI